MKTPTGTVPWNPDGIQDPLQYTQCVFMVKALTAEIKDKYAPGSMRKRALDSMSEALYWLERTPEEVGKKNDAS